MFNLYYLVIVVSERVLGLSLLVGATYNHGSDYVKSVNRVRC